MSVVAGRKDEEEEAGGEEGRKEIKR